MMGEKVYLEPGEIDILSKVVRRAAAEESVSHPRMLLLMALAEELAHRARHPYGCVLLTATEEDARRCALQYIKEDSGGAPSAPSPQGTLPPQPTAQKCNRENSAG